MTVRPFLLAGLLLVLVSGMIGVGVGYAVWGDDAEEPHPAATSQYPFFRDVAVPRYVWFGFATEGNLTPDCSSLAAMFNKQYAALSDTAQSNYLKSLLEGTTWTEITCVVVAPLTP